MAMVWADEARSCPCGHLPSRIAPCLSESFLSTAQAFGTDRTEMGPDGLHPSDRGYEIMAESWFRVI